MNYLKKKLNRKLKNIRAKTILFEERIERAINEEQPSTVASEILTSPISEKTEKEFSKALKKIQKFDDNLKSTIADSADDEDLENLKKLSENLEDSIMSYLKLVHKSLKRIDFLVLNTVYLKNRINGLKHLDNEEILD